MMTEKDLVGLAAFGRHVESKRCGPEFVEILDGHNENWPLKWVFRVDRFKGSSKGTWDLRRINDVKFMVCRRSNARPDSKDQRHFFGGTRMKTWIESCFPMRSCSSWKRHLNAQNDRVYAAAFEDIPEQVRTVQLFQKPRSVMVCGAVSS